jgi:uroporphyrinogen-III synthase
MLGNAAKKNIWVLRSAYGSPELMHGLQNNGATVSEVILYTLKKRCGLPQRDFMRKIVAGDVAAVLFTSAQTVRAFFDCADRISIRERLVERLADTLIGAIGKPTADALEINNVGVDVTAEHATFNELVSAVHLMLRNGAPK